MISCVPLSWGEVAQQFFRGLEGGGCHGLDRDDKDHDYLEAKFVQFLYYPSLGILKPFPWLWKSVRWTCLQRGEYEVLQVLPKLLGSSSDFICLDYRDKIATMQTKYV